MEKQWHSVHVSIFGVAVITSRLEGLALALKDFLLSESVRALAGCVERCLRHLFLCTGNSMKGTGASEASMEPRIGA